MPLDDNSEATVKFFEQALKPCSKQVSNVHLTRLSIRKPIGGGEGRNFVVLEDLTNELDGYSEFVIIKTCDEVRATEGNFFPTDNTIPRIAKRIHEEYKAMMPKEQQVSDAREIKTEPEKDRSYWTRKACQAWPNQAFSVIDALPLIYQLFEHKDPEKVVEMIKNEQQGIGFIQYLKGKIEVQNG